MIGCIFDVAIHASHYVLLTLALRIGPLLVIHARSLFQVGGNPPLRAKDKTKKKNNYRGTKKKPRSR